jgi:hypothetical protein
MQLVFFRSDFLNKLIRMHSANDIELFDSFEFSKRKILEMSVQRAMNESALNSPLRDTKLDEKPNEEARDEELDDDAFESEDTKSDENQRYVNAGNELRYVNGDD